MRTRLWLITHRSGQAADHCVVPDLAHVIDEVAQLFENNRTIVTKVEHALADAIRDHAVDFLSGQHIVRVRIDEDPILSSPALIVHSTLEIYLFDLEDRAWFGTLTAME